MNQKLSLLLLLLLLTTYRLIYYALCKTPLIIDVLVLSISTSVVNGHSVWRFQRGFNAVSDIFQ